MKTSQDIPFLDLITPHQEIEEQLTSVFRHALKTACFVGGPALEEFEKQFAQFCETRFCVGVGSGTDAVRFCLMAAGVGSGDIVVTVPNTFIATTEAISQVGAHPRFVDVDERTYNMDPVRLQEYLETKCQVNATTGVLEERETRARVAAILPVHLYGQMADMDAILEQAEWYGLLVIEDACQAHGAMYFSKKDGQWHKAGSMGLAGAFSFYPGKNLGACGEAGAVTTRNEALAIKIKMIRDHGQKQKYFHEMEGYNGRLDALQAAILGIKLQRLASWNEQRRQRSAEYHRLIEAAGRPVHAPYELSGSYSVYHLYVIRTAARDGLLAHLNTAGIGTGIHYPVPLHLQKAYAHLKHGAGDFLVCEKAATQILSLPMYPHITPAQQARVVEEISRFVNALRLREEADSKVMTGTV